MLTTVVPFTAPRGRLQVTVVVISGITVLLWCANTALAGVIGNQGIVAILPLAVFFGTGILDKDDFNGFLWHVVMLAQVSTPATATAVNALSGLSPENGENPDSSVRGRLDFAPMPAQIGHAWPPPHMHGNPRIFVGTAVAGHHGPAECSTRRRPCCYHRSARHSAQQL